MTAGVDRGARPHQLIGYDNAFPNLLINPGFEIWQRGAGPFNTVVTTHTVFTADEWAVLTNGGTATAQRSSSPASGVYALEMSCSTNILHGISQGVEQYKSLEGLYITFSVSVKCSAVNDTRILIADYISSSDAAYSDYHPGDSAWHRLTVTKLIRTGLATYAPWAHAFGIVLQVGSVGTGSVFVDEAVAVAAKGPFPEGLVFTPPNPADDMTRCERFFEVHGGVSQTVPSLYQYATTAGYFGYAVPWHTVKYATPTLTKAGTWAVANCGQPAVAGASTKGYFIYATPSSNARSGFWADSADDLVTGAIP